MKRTLIALIASFGVLSLAGGVVGQGAQAQNSRSDLSKLVGYETFRSASMSPDGTLVAGIYRDSEDDLLVIINRATGTSTPIQRARADQGLSLTYVTFKGDDRVLFGLQQKYEIVSNSSRGRTKTKAKEDGRFGYVSRAYVMDTDGKNLISLYEPAQESHFPRWLSANVVDVLRSDPQHVLMRIPTTSGVELRKMNIIDGEYSVIEQGGYRTMEWALDSDLNPVLRHDIVAGGRGHAWLRKDNSGEWVEILRFRGADGANGAPEFNAVGRGTKPGTAIVSARPQGKDTNGVYLFEAGTGSYLEELYSDEAFDVVNVLRDPKTAEVIAGCHWAYKLECEFKNPQFQSTWDAINGAIGGENTVYLQPGGDLSKEFLLEVSGSKEPGAYYVFDAEKRELSYFQPKVTGVDVDLLPSQEVFHYTAKDGTPLWGYLTLPPGTTINSKNLPLITLPHGGPEARDVWGGDPMSNYWGANGYAVFQPHFRGGSGTGRKWVEAGHGQWGQLIQSDINDGTRALIEAGLADEDRICIAGWSHGGYVAFTASYQDTDLYKCAMAGAGLSDLRKMQDWVRDEQGGRQSMSYKYWAEAIGDPSKDKDKMDRHSAFRNVEKIGMPLLIVHGENDTTVPVEQSLIMDKALSKERIPHETLIIADMDHYLRADQGDMWLQVLQRSTAFFNQHIGSVPAE